MKVFLINGPIPYKDAVTHIPLDLSYIGGMLKQNKIEVKGFDLAIERDIEDITRKISEEKPDVIITCFSRVLFDGTRCLKMSMDFLSDLKKVLPSTHICAIGEQATFRTARTLEYDFIDSVIRFSSEKTAVELCLALNENKDIDDIRGVYTKDNAQEKLDDKSWYTPLKSLDELSVPDRTVFNIPLYLKKDNETTIEASRGCSHRCDFCQRSRYHKNNIYRSIPLVIEDLKECENLGFASVFFTDLDFCRNVEKAMNLVKAMIEAEINVKWACNMRADIIDKENHMELLTSMKKAGCYRVFVGLETANDELLSSVNKGITMDYGIRLKKVLDEVGIKLHASFLVGLPDDTVEKMDNTIKYAKLINADMTSINSLIPLPGTPYGDDPEKYGLSIRNGEEHWYEIADFMDKQICGNRNLTAGEIQNWHKTSYRRFLMDDET